MSENWKHVVVVGAGFAGLSFCQCFRHPNTRISIVDRTNHHLFQPLLYQVAMAGLSGPDIAQPIRSILSTTPNLRVLLEQVQDIDLRHRRVLCSQRTLDYDYLILAAGGVTSYFGRDEWEPHAPGLKTLADALLIRRNVLLAFERAENERNPVEQQRLMTIVVVGGGPTGVELAGACAELAHRVLRRDFDYIDPRRAKIILIEAAPHILRQFPEELSLSARRQLERIGVQVQTGHQVKSIERGRVTLTSGEVILAGNILWGAGVMAHPLTRKLGVELDRAGRIKVNHDLSLPGHPEVFAVGDLAAVVQHDGRPVPGVAPAAIQMAHHVARVLRRELDAQTEKTARPEFRYRDKGMLATIGRSAGVAVLGRLRLKGFPAWFAWLAVHLVFLIGFRNKLAVLVSWTYSYFTYKLGARIIPDWPEPSQTNPPTSPPH